MKKTFPLQIPGKDAARALAIVKHEVRKYVQREQRKKPPEGFNRWEFNCCVGADKSAPVGRRLSEVIDAIDAAAKAGATEVYVEILAAPAFREPPAADEAPGRQR